MLNTTNVLGLSGSTRMQEGFERMLKGFKEFLSRGNIVDLAVAVVIGTAFTALVTKFTDSIITPLINRIGAGGDAVDQRRDDAVGELRDQGRERGTDDHRDGKVDDVAPGQELLEALQHALESLLHSCAT